MLCDDERVYGRRKTDRAGTARRTAGKAKQNIGGLVIFLVVAALGGGGALYYFKIWKPKQNVKGSTDLDEFDFEDYDEDELEETDDTGGGETEGEEV